MLALDQPLEQHSFSKEPAKRYGNKKTPMQKACDRADTSLTMEQTSALFALHNKHSEVFSPRAEDFERKHLYYHTIDIGDSGPVRQGKRRIYHEQIEVLKLEVDKLQSARIVGTRFRISRAPLYWYKRITTAGVSESITVSSTR